MKILSLLFCLLVLTPACLHAATEKKLTAKEKERAEIKEARDKERDAVKGYLEGRDKNKDGSLTREEFIADEADKEAAGAKFDEANTNKDRSLSKGEIADMLGVGDEVKKVKDSIRDKKKPVKK